MKTSQEETKPDNAGAQRSADLRRQLKSELVTAGCFAPVRLRQGLHMIFVLTAYFAGYALLLTDPGVAARIATLVLLAFISVQAGYIAHEAGPRCVTRTSRKFTFVIIAIATTRSAISTCSRTFSACPRRQK